MFLVRSRRKENHTCNPEIGGTRPGRDLADVAIQVGDAIVTEAGRRNSVIVGGSAYVIIAAIQDAGALEDIVVILMGYRLASSAR